MDGIVFRFLLPKLRELRRKRHVSWPSSNRAQTMARLFVEGRVRMLHCEVLPMDVLSQLILLVRGEYRAELFRDLLGAFAIEIDGLPYICISPAAARLPDEQLAFILAHEGGHLAFGHTAEPGDQVTHAFWRNPIGKLVVAAKALDGLPPGTGLLDGALQVGAQLHGIAKRCMQDELDADRFAVRQMFRHGFDVSGAVDVLRHFEELEGNEPERTRVMHAVFGTHPSPTERIRRIQTGPS